MDRLTAVAPGATAAGMRVVTLAERPELAAAFDGLSGAAWPEFMHHRGVDGKAWRSLSTRFGAFQVAVLDAAGGLLAAGGPIPRVWDGTIGDRETRPG